MLALAQVERICIPVHGEMHSTNRETDLSNEKDDLNEEFAMEGTSAEENHKCINAPFICLFKISVSMSQVLMLSQMVGGC